MSQDDATATAPAETPTLFTVVRGEPDAQELAALTVVLAGAISGDDDGPGSPRSFWADPRRRMNVVHNLRWRR